MNALTTAHPFQAALAQATKAIPIHLGGPELEQALFPFWVEAIHQNLIPLFCGCQKNLPDSVCFRDMPASEQVALFASSSLAFSEFLEIYREGHEALLTSLKASPNA